MISKPKPVICDECIKVGNKSIIVSSSRGGGATMDMFHEPKYVFDEDGYEHFHDDHYQVSRKFYTCKAGHYITVYKVEECWCGWGEKDIPWLAAAKERL